jgi:hypothetical protein
MIHKLINSILLGKNCLISGSSLKQGDTLLPLLFNYALEYGIRNVRENQVGLKMNGTYQLLVYVVDLNLLDHNISTIKKF